MNDKTLIELLNTPKIELSTWQDLVMRSYIVMLFIIAFILFLVGIELFCWARIKMSDATRKSKNNLKK